MAMVTVSRGTASATLAMEVQTAPRQSALDHAPMYAHNKNLFCLQLLHMAPSNPSLALFHLIALYVLVI